MMKQWSIKRILAGKEKTSPPPVKLARVRSQSGEKKTTMASTPKTSKSPSTPTLIEFLSMKAQQCRDIFGKKQQRKTGSTSGKLVVAAKNLPPALRVLTFPWRNKLVRYSLVVVLLLSVVGLLYILRELPSPQRLVSEENFPVSTQIFDRKGRLLYEIIGSQHRIPIQIQDLPPHVYQSTIAIEDERFYRHFGFDIWGILRALRSIVQGKRLEGGSTITQQLVKNGLLTNERSITRKLKEVVLAIATEVVYSKEEILEMYLNYISYGGNSVGVEAASEKFFSKPAKDMTLAEAAMIAGLPQSPSRYSPFGSNPEAAKQRQRDVLRQMRANGYITAEQEEAAKNEVLKFAISRTDIQAPHFVFYVRDYLYQKYGEKRVEQGGFRVTTTLDLDLQNTAQASVSAQVEKLKAARVSNGAAMIVKPNTGEILAMIGSKDYFNTAEDGQVNVTLAERQPGSSIKPLMYATAFQAKLLNPGSYLLDIPTCFSVAGQKPYCPKNYDGSFRGSVTIRQSLGNSLNIPAVKGLRLIGLVDFINQAREMGVTSWVDPSRYGLSLTLGGGEVRMIDMAQAFSVLADQGVKVPLTSILKIEDYRGNLIEQIDTKQRQTDLQYLSEYEDETEKNELTRVMDRAPAYLTGHIMQDNTARTQAFGPRSKLVIPNQIVSVKTGTTNDLKDNWTIGFTPEFLVATWVGNNDGRPMSSALVSGITGAAPIWNDIMSFVLKDQTAKIPDKPSDVSAAQVCVHGMPPQPNENCPLKSHELFWRKSNPSKAQYVTKEIWIRPETGLPPNPGESTDGLQLQNKTVITDPFTTDYCADCARPIDDQGKTVYERQTIDQNANLTSSASANTNTTTTPVTQ